MGGCWFVSIFRVCAVVKLEGVEVVELRVKKSIGWVITVSRARPFSTRYFVFSDMFSILHHSHPNPSDKHGQFHPIHFILPARFTPSLFVLTSFRKFGRWTRSRTCLETETHLLNIGRLVSSSADVTSAQKYATSRRDEVQAMAGLAVAEEAFWSRALAYLGLSLFLSRSANCGKSAFRESAASTSSHCRSKFIVVYDFLRYILNQLKSC